MLFIVNALINIYYSTLQLSQLVWEVRKNFATISRLINIGQYFKQRHQV